MCACAFAVEFTVILVLTSLPTTLMVIMGYVSLSATVNIPRFYFGSLREHKLTACAGHKLPISNFRKDHPLEGAPLAIRFYRFIQKTMRVFFSSWSFYFMPFTSMGITYLYGLSKRMKIDTNKLD